MMVASKVCDILGDDMESREKLTRIPRLKESCVSPQKVVLFGVCCMIWIFLMDMC